MIASPLLVRWYGVLATLGGVLAIQAIVMPRWPAAPEALPQRQLEASLRAKGLLPSSAPAKGSSGGWPARRSYELSTSAPVIIPLRDGYEFIAMAGSVRQRLNLQSSFIGRDQPRLALTKRHLVTQPVPGAAGLVQGQPALQTCLVRGGDLKEAFGVTRVQLAPLSDRLAQGRVVGLERLVGLRPNRSYGCTLISLRGPKGTPPPERLWKDILQAVEPVLRSPA